MARLILYGRPAPLCPAIPFGGKQLVWGPHRGPETIRLPSYGNMSAAVSMNWLGIASALRMIDTDFLQLHPASETFTAGFPSPGAMVIVLSASGVLAGDVRQGQRLAEHGGIRLDAERLLQLREQGREQVCASTKAIAALRSTLPCYQGAASSGMHQPFHHPAG